MIISLIIDDLTRRPPKNTKTRKPAKQARFKGLQKQTTCLVQFLMNNQKLLSDLNLDADSKIAGLTQMSN